MRENKRAQVLACARDIFIALSRNAGKVQSSLSLALRAAAAQPLCALCLCRLLLAPPLRLPRRTGQARTLMPRKRAAIDIERNVFACGRHRALLSAKQRAAFR